MIVAPIMKPIIILLVHTRSRHHCTYMHVHMYDASYHTAHNLFLLLLFTRSTLPALVYFIDRARRNSKVKLSVDVETNDSNEAKGSNDINTRAVKPK